MASLTSFRSNWLLIVAFMLVPSLAWAGQIVKKDGSVVYGQIVEENDKEVVIATSRKGMSLKMAIYRTEIESIDKNAAEPASPAVESAKAVAAPAKAAVSTFYPLPMVGVIGKEVTAATLKAGLGEARAGKTQYVVLVIDTPGGSPDEMYAILDVLANTRDMTVVAYVKQAVSAGAMVAMACPNIVMTADATFGAGVPWEKSPAGTPAADAAKLETAMRTKCREMAEHAGHSPLLVDGMFDMGLVLGIVTENGKPKVVEGAAPGAKSLKSPGEILCMTASDAQAAGLLAGTSATLENVRMALGIDRWDQVRAHGAVANKAAEDQKEQRYREFKAAKIAKRDEARRRLGPPIKALDEQLAQVQSRGKAVQDTLADLTAENNAEIARIKKEYNLAFLSSGNDPKLFNRAREIRDAKLFEVQQRYQPQFADLEAQINTLNQQQQLLKAKIEPLASELKKAEQL